MKETPHWDSFSAFLLNPDMHLRLADLTGICLAPSLPQQPLKISVGKKLLFPLSLFLSVSDPRIFLK